MDTTNGLNGHHTNGLNGRALADMAATQKHLQSTPKSGFTGHPSHVRILDLVRDAVDLDLRLKGVMNEIDEEMRKVGNSDFPAILMSLMHRHQQHVPQLPPGPSVAKATVHKGKGGRKKKVEAAPALGNMPGGKWPAKIMGLLGDGKERTSSQIVEQLKSKSPTTIYSLLAKLARMGYLMKPSYGVYRLKMRKVDKT